jgi:hypothetical protein
MKCALMLFTTMMGEYQNYDMKTASSTEDCPSRTTEEYALRIQLFRVRVSQSFSLLFVWCELVTLMLLQIVINDQLSSISELKENFLKFQTPCK